MRAGDGMAADGPSLGPVHLPCHFGERLQGRLGADGPLTLVTLAPKGLVLPRGGVQSETFHVTPSTMAA